LTLFAALDGALQGVALVVGAAELSQVDGVFGGEITRREGGFTARRVGGISSDLSIHIFRPLLNPHFIPLAVFTVRAPPGLNDAGDHRLVDMLLVYRGEITGHTGAFLALAGERVINFKGVVFHAHRLPGLGDAISGYGNIRKQNCRYLCDHQENRRTCAASHSEQMVICDNCKFMLLWGGFELLKPLGH
jgi:hypothetical protein